MTKAISLDNLAQFKAKCDETYEKKGEGLKTVDLGEFSGSILTSDSFKTTISVDTELLNNLWEANNISFTLSLSMEGVTISQNLSIPITSKIEMMGIKSIEAEGIVQISGGMNSSFYDHGYTICRFKQESDAGEYSLIAYVMGDNPATKMPHPYSGDTGKVPVVNSSSNGYELVSYKSTIVDRVGGAPIAVENSPDFVEVGGTLYRKKASEVTGLIGNWTFNSNASLSVVSGKTFNVNFSSNSSTFNSIVITSSGDGNYIMYYDSTQVHSTKETDDNVTSSNWNNAYQNIQITNTSSLTNALEFFFWLNENATQTSGGASVSYEYVAQQDAGAGGGGGTKLYEHYFNISSALGESGQLITGADKCTLSYIRVISITPDEYATFNDFYDDILYKRIIHMEHSSVNATIQWYVQSGDREHDNDWISTYAYLYVFYRTGITTFRLNPTAGPNAISSDTVTPL